jgi:MerR family mercuric resistance operon transcriptional regulator
MAIFLSQDLTPYQGTGFSYKKDGDCRMKTLTIGQLARQAQVNVETIRYYERRDLIEQPERPGSGFRRYGPEVIVRICFIKRAQDLVFSLGEISDLLSLRVDPQSTCADVRLRAEDKIADIEEKVQDLQKMKSALEKLAASCHGRGPVSACPVLDALEGVGEIVLT